MINIKRFFDRVTSMDQNPGKSLVIPIAEARQLRDEIAKLLMDRVEIPQVQTSSTTQSDVIQIEMKGGKF